MAIQIFVIFLLLALFSLLIILLLKKFRKDLRITLLFIAPLLIFCLGFGMRLSAAPKMVDLGFFFTEFSGLFVSVLFAVCLMLGQLKYWGK